MKIIFDFCRFHSEKKGKIKHFPIKIENKNKFKFITGSIELCALFSNILNHNIQEVLDCHDLTNTFVVCSHFRQQLA